MIKYILYGWWAWQRALDMRILWPICKHQAPNLAHARAAFAAHAFSEDAWVRYYGRRQLFRVIEDLK